MPYLFPLPLLAPLLLLASAAVSTMCPGRRPGLYPKASEASAFIALVLALAGLVQLLVLGATEATLFEGPFTLVVRLDPISVTMTLLVTFIGWVVMRYSRTYLDGETREGAFHGLMLTALAAVLVVVQSGSLFLLVLGFAGIGLCLRRLLLFYPQRAAAQRAATKFALVWHAGDISLLLAAGLFMASTGTAQLGQLSETVGPDLSFVEHLAVVFLVLAAVLKTAAFPCTAG